MLITHSFLGYAADKNDRKGDGSTISLTMLLPYTLGIIEDHVPTEALEGKQIVTVEHGQPKWLWFFR